MRYCFSRFSKTALTAHHKEVLFCYLLLPDETCAFYFCWGNKWQHVNDMNANILFDLHGGKEIHSCQLCSAQWFFWSTASFIAIAVNVKHCSIFGEENCM